MISYYLTLGVTLEANDHEIRKKYLTLIKQHTPEKSPDRFQQVTTAYEKIKSSRARIRTALFEIIENANTESALLALGEAASPQRVRVGLKTLMQTLSAMENKTGHK